MDNTVEKIKNAIAEFEDKSFSVMFFVMDSKGAPIGSLAYIYETAYQLKEMGYNVKMLHADDDFIGVDSWLGEKYSSLAHYNINKDRAMVSAGPSDFLFIPEIYANIMAKTKTLPCKRVAILQNFGYLTEIIPVGATWDDLKIHDCIATSESLKERLHDIFPDVVTRIVRPSIPDYFQPPKAQKLMINVVAKNQSEMNSVVKQFYWKYPLYRWVAFRNVANLERHEFAKALAEGFATLWIDTTTDFGYSALEAMSCGNLVIGKIPENTPDWMVDNLGRFNDSGLWFYKNNEAQDAIASAIQSFITDTVPESTYESMKDVVKPYTPEAQQEDIKTVYCGLFEQRKKELETFLAIYEKQQKDNEEKEKENNG